MHDRHSDFGKHAFRLCKGTGLEIGALHSQFDLQANVVYLDRYGNNELRRAYAGDSRVDNIRPVHLVSGKNDVYSFIDDNAWDFVISSHVLEHTCNPGRMIEEWLRIVRSGGLVYMVFPDKRFCFDRRRDVTPVSHLMEQFEDKTKITSIEKYRDFIYKTEGEDGIKRNPTETFVQKCFDAQSSIHVNTFTSDSAMEFMSALSEVLNFNIIFYEFQGLHIHFCLEKY